MISRPAIALCVGAVVAVAAALVVERTNRSRAESAIQPWVAPQHQPAAASPGPVPSKSDLEYRALKAEIGGPLDWPEIGMTAERVRQTRWGRPDSINSTTTARGTSEQWVYKYRGYLYFNNDVLTSIQQSR